MYLELKLSYLYCLAIRLNFVSQVIVVKCWTWLLYLGKCQNKLIFFSIYFFFSAAFKVTCIKLDRSLLPLFVSKWFCDEFFFHIPLQIHYGGVVTEGKSQGQRKQKIFLPIWREALPVCSIQIMKAKNYFACLVICVLLDITTFRVVYFFSLGQIGKVWYKERSFYWKQ